MTGLEIVGVALVGWWLSRPSDGVTRYVPVAGDRVEIRIDGKWYAGTVDPGAKSVTIQPSGDSKAIQPDRPVRLLKSAPPAAANATTTHPSDEAEKLIARANQTQALSWEAMFGDATGNPDVAAAEARWAGIESSGNPHATSELGEYGLMQFPRDAVGQKILTQAEWDALHDPNTRPETHAALNARYVAQLSTRAAKYVKDYPADPVDRVWYAKLWHAYPKDVKEGKLHGPARAMARELLAKSTGKKLHRVLAANIIAFGIPTP